MKHVFLVLATAIIAVTSSYSFGMSTIGEKGDDSLFVSEEGKFSVDFLGATPGFSSTNVDTDVGSIVLNMYMYEKGEDQAFMVAYCDYPPEMVDESDGAIGLLEGAKNGALGNLNIESPETENDIELDGHQGMSFSANNGEFFVTYEIYLVGNRLYQIAILRLGEYASKKDKKTFMKSFQLISEEKK